MNEMNCIQEMAAVEIVLASVCVLVGSVVAGFVCRLLLAVSKFFEAKAAKVRHENALENYHENN